MVSKGEITGLIQKEEKDLFCFGIAKIYGQKQLNIKEWSHIFFNYEYSSLEWEIRMKKKWER